MIPYHVFIADDGKCTVGPRRVMGFAALYPSYVIGNPWKL